MNSLPLLALEECRNHKITLETNDRIFYSGILMRASRNLDCTLAEVHVEYNNQEIAKKEGVYVPGRRINYIILPPSVAERLIGKSQEELQNKEKKSQTTPTTQHQGVTHKQSTPQDTTPKNQKVSFYHRGSSSVPIRGQKLQFSPVQNNQQHTATAFIPQFHENVQYAQSPKQTGSKEVQGAQSSQQQQPQTQNVTQQSNVLVTMQSEAAGQNYYFYEAPAVPQMQGYQFYPIPQQQQYPYTNPYATQGQQQISSTVVQHHQQYHQQQYQYYVQNSQHIQPNSAPQVPMQYEPVYQVADPNQAYTSGFAPLTQQSVEAQPVVYYQVPTYEQPQWPTTLHQPHTDAVQPPYVYTYPQFDPNAMYQTVPPNVHHQMQPPPP